MKISALLLYVTGQRKKTCDSLSFLFFWFALSLTWEPEPFIYLRIKWVCVTKNKFRHHLKQSTTISLLCSALQWTVTVSTALLPPATQHWTHKAKQKSHAKGGSTQAQKYTRPIIQLQIIWCGWNAIFFLSFQMNSWVQLYTQTYTLCGSPSLSSICMFNSPSIHHATTQ